jgi:quercetin dioxygenase-like cupin family protein
MTTDVLTSRDALETLYSVDAVQIDALPWEPVPGCTGVTKKLLWHLGGFTQALIHYEPGATTAGEPHLAAHHHIWVVSGAITIAGRRLIAGSYMHVPPGVRHFADEVGGEGCTLLQMHRPHPPTEAELLVRQGR